MKINIIEDPDIVETEINVICKRKTPDLYDALSEIGVLADTYVGKVGYETHFVALSEIFYFETVDDKVFFYTEKLTYETGLRLYKIEEMLESTSFQRISKTTIVNLRKIISIKPAKHSKLEATLKSGDRLIVSRFYVGQIRNKLRCVYEKNNCN